MKPIYGCLLMLVMIFPMALFAKSDSTTVNFTKPIVVAGSNFPQASTMCTGRATDPPYR